MLLDGRAIRAPIGEKDEVRLAKFVLITDTGLILISGGLACPVLASDQKAAASSRAPGSVTSLSILALVAAISFATTLLRIATGLRSYPFCSKKFAVGTLSRMARGIVAISKPLPSPVRFIISSSTAVRTP
jgi:hypothetical protein